MVAFKRAPGSCAGGDCCEPNECEIDCSTRDNSSSITNHTVNFSEILFELINFPANATVWVFHELEWHKITIIGFDQINGTYSVTPNSSCNAINRPDVDYEVDFDVSVYPFDSGGPDPLCPDEDALVTIDSYSGTLHLSFVPNMGIAVEIDHDVLLEITIDSFPTLFANVGLGRIDALIPDGDGADNFNTCAESRIRYRTPIVIGNFNCGIGGVFHGDGSTATTI
jgi:hypothetical protein